MSHYKDVLFARRTKGLVRISVYWFITTLLISVNASAQHISSKEFNDLNPPQIIVFGTTNAKNTLLFRQAQHVLTYAFNQLGHDFRLLHLPNKRALIWSNDEKLDGVAFRVATIDADRYPNLVIVDESLFVREQSVFSRKTIDIDGWESMKELSVAYEQGTQFIENNRHHFKALYPVISTVKAFDMVFDGDADITITSKATGQLLLKNHRAQFNDEISLQTPYLVEIELYSFMHKKHQILAEKLQKKLRQMKKEGSYQRLLDAAR